MDYTNTHFYKLVCKDLDIKDMYVGHTTNFAKRKHHHKNLCQNTNNRGFHRFLYQFLRENGGWENWDMILITTECCMNSLEAVSKERKHIETLKASLNQQRPHITREEEHMYDKEYYQRNKQKYKEYKKVDYETKKQQYSTNAKTYYQNHKEELKQKSKDRYYKNKEIRIN